MFTCIVIDTTDSSASLGTGIPLPTRLQTAQLGTGPVPGGRDQSAVRSGIDTMGAIRPRWGEDPALEIGVWDDFIETRLASDKEAQWHQSVNPPGDGRGDSHLLHRRLDPPLRPPWLREAAGLLYGYDDPSSDGNPGPPAVDRCARRGGPRVMRRQRPPRHRGISGAYERRGTLSSAEGSAGRATAYKSIRRRPLVRCVYTLVTTFAATICGACSC